MTGTPVGTALGVPPKPVASLLPAAVKWKAFFKRQANNPQHLQHGDIVELSVATDDGAIDLGAQRTAVRYLTTDLLWSTPSNRETWSPSSRFQRRRTAIKGVLEC